MRKSSIATALLILCVLGSSVQAAHEVEAFGSGANWYNWVQVGFGMLHGTYSRVSYNVQDTCYTNVWALADNVVSFSHYFVTTNWTSW